MSQQQQQPSYYAVIPADVRYDRDLCANAKLLYGEISSLCNVSGYCWAANEYFADLYEVTDRQIRRWIKSLNDKGYLHIEIENNRLRKIFIKVDKKDRGGGQKRPPITKYNKKREKEDPENTEKLSQHVKKKAVGINDDDALVIAIDYTKKEIDYAFKWLDKDRKHIKKCDPLAMLYTYLKKTRKIFKHRGGVS